MVEEKIYFNNKLESKMFFLSASIPKINRDKRFLQHMNPLNVTNAVVEMVKLILLRKGKIVFGGHPSISPLILSVIDNLFEDSIDKIKEDLPKCKIYQSKYFKGQQSEFTDKLSSMGYGEIIWTPKAHTLAKSLEIMRKQMLEENKMDGSIFIGGMEGIREEFDLFLSKYPDKPIFLVGSAGGNTRIILEELIKKKDIKKLNYGNEDLVKKLLNLTSYSALARYLFKSI